jgi:hypothetical protein
VLGEFFAARLDDIDDAVLEGGPMNRFETVEAKTVSSVSIATLGEVLGIGTYEDVFDLVDQGRLADHGEAGIDVVPDSLRDALASEHDSARVAKQWHDTDEMRDWSAEEVLEVTKELAVLARRASAADSRLCFWWSL